MLNNIEKIAKCYFKPNKQSVFYLSMETQDVSMYGDECETETKIIGIFELKQIKKAVILGKKLVKLCLEKHEDMTWDENEHSLTSWIQTLATPDNTIDNKKYPKTRDWDRIIIRITIDIAPLNPSKIKL